MEQIIEDMVGVTYKALRLEDASEQQKLLVKMAFLGGMAASFDIVMNAAHAGTEDEGVMSLERFNQAVRKISMDTGYKIKQYQKVN